LQWVDGALTTAAMCKALAQFVVQHAPIHSSARDKTASFVEQAAHLHVSTRPALKRVTMSKTLSFETTQAQTGGPMRMTFEHITRRIFRDYTPEMSAPQGSTMGTVWVVQYIRLLSKDGLSIVVGTVSPREKVAELRTLGATLERSKERFGKELAIPPAEYAKFLETSRKVLEEFEMTVTVVSRTTSDPNLAAAPKKD
jgi:hypothetical protein